MVDNKDCRYGKHRRTERVSLIEIGTRQIDVSYCSVPGIFNGEESPKLVHTDLRVSLGAITSTSWTFS